MDSSRSPNKTPRWVLFLVCLPALGIMVAIISIEASIIAKFHPRDLSSLFKVTLNTDNVIPSAVFKPALERAGYNLSANLSNSTRFTSHLSHKYILQDKKYSVCSKIYDYYSIGNSYYTTDTCETQKVMEGSVFADFPRQFLFDATLAIQDTMTNASISLQSPDDIVPLMPEGYMNEMFEEVRATYMNPYVLGIVFSAIGAVVVPICIAICIIKSTPIANCASIVGVVFVIQGFKVALMALVFSSSYDIATSKAHQFFSNHYSWGLSLSGCSALYKATHNGFPLMVLNVPLSICGLFSAVAILELPEFIAKFKKERKSKKEEQQVEEEREDRLV